MTDRYTPGDLVRDNATGIDESGTVVVVTYPNAPIEQMYIDSHTTVADANPDFPPDDPAVSVAYEGWLDQYIGPFWREYLDADDAILDRFTDEQWRQTPPPLPPDDMSFYHALVAHTQSWGIPLKCYTYPESRLSPRPWCRCCKQRAEHLPSVGWSCTNPDCETPEVVTEEALHALDEVTENE